LLYFLIHHAWHARRILRFPPACDRLGVCRMDGADHFKAAAAAPAFHVPFIFVHLCHRINSLSDYS
jgi:hypothetical protein